MENSMNATELQKMIDDDYFPKCTGWEHISGLEYLGKMVVNRRRDVAYNVVSSQKRTHDNVASRSHQHNTSFKGGIDPTKPNPVLELKNTGTYDQVDGYGRDAGFDKLDWDHYVYDVFKCRNEIARADLRFWLNRKMPKEDNAEQDLINGYTDLVNRKRIKSPTLESLTKKLKQVEPHRDAKFLGRVAQAILDRTGKSNKPEIDKITSYTADTLISQYVRENWANEPVYGFVNGLNTHPLSGDKGKHQGSINSGKRGNASFKVKMYDAFRRYVKEGVQTEYILRIGDANTVEQLNTLRKELWNNIKEYMTLHPHDDWDKAVNILGFVPQHNNEDVKNLITVDCI